jgi:ubiquinone/menaquinone biosynthesis C-methylase UbiE
LLPSIIFETGGRNQLMDEIKMQRVNYDKIAHLYDEPSRDHIVDPNLIEYVEDHPELGKAEIRFLDIGCGTGKQLSANRKHLPRIELIGMDLFFGMLREAKQRERTICWVQGDGACVSLASESVHYVVNQFSYPHIQHKGMFMREVYRVLKPQG